MEKKRVTQAGKFSAYISTNKNKKGQTIFADSLSYTKITKNLKL